jgi:hypothetical protein
MHASARRALVASCLLLLTSLYAVGLWAFVEADMRAAVAGGASPLTTTLHAQETAIRGTWAGVAGASIAHAATWWLGRRDPAARAGVWISLAGHVVLALAWGVVGA